MNVAPAAVATHAADNRMTQSLQRRINRYFTAATFGAPPIAGSAVSFLYAGGGLWALVQVLRGRCALSRQPDFRATTAALYAYCIALAISAIVNPNFADSLASLAGLGSLLLFPFAYSTWRIADRRQIVEACLIACAAASIGGLLLALAQVHLFGLARAEGGAGNALVFANVIALTGSVSLIGAFSHRGGRRLFQLGGLLASALAIGYADSRGPFLLLIVNTLLVSAIYGRGRRSLVSMAAAIFLGAVLFAAIAGTLLYHRLDAMVADVAAVLHDGDFTTSVGKRFALWQTGIELWQQKPLFGYGAGNVRQLINLGLEENYDISVHYTHFHNIFVNTLVAGGLAGLAGLILMIAVPLRTALRTLLRSECDSARFGASLLLVFFSMFLMTGMTNIVLHHDVMDAVFMCFLAVGLFLATGDNVEAAAEPSMSAAPG